MLDNLFQPTHLLVVLFIALLVLDPRSCPNSARAWVKESEASGNR